jgi:branched-chain amino acid transport system permease protein
MLTLSFGMLFYSFLNKFYDLTGGDSGMNVSQPSLLGIDFSQVDKMGFLTGPFYYYCLAADRECVDYVAYSPIALRATSSGLT